MTQLNINQPVVPRRVAPKPTRLQTISLRKRGNGGWSEIRFRLGTPRAAKPSMEQRLRHQMICSPC
ncbi:hypothetical protein [Nereida sp. MMG025]|uniref:hypothetical protein n=1 Tax=Nereida sp. MMG025 TaxID=2909981 RepID=UPI001F31E6B4|nr:hypothetical protein [Nereida sp. MMG025]MCF6443382.1 hypothetical protein [Nereida sp. MMG025]